MYARVIKDTLKQLHDQINDLSTEELIALYELHPSVIAQKAFNDALVYTVKGSEEAILNSGKIKIDSLNKDDAILVGRGLAEVVNKVAEKLDGTPYFDTIVRVAINNLEISVEEE